MNEPTDADRARDLAADLVNLTVLDAYEFEDWALDNVAGWEAAARRALAAEALLRRLIETGDLAEVCTILAEARGLMKEKQ